MDTRARQHGLPNGGRLGGENPSVLLLTATPQQLGAEGHFARLRLLDPVRYNDLERFVQESDQYQEMAELVDRIEGKEELTESEWGMIEKTVPHLHARYSGQTLLCFDRSGATHREHHR